MLYTPGTWELALRFAFSLGGEPERPSTAESTLESGSVMVMMWVLRCWMGCLESERGNAS